MMNEANRRRNRGVAACFVLAFAVAGLASAQIVGKALAPIAAQGVPAMAVASPIGTVRMGQTSLYLHDAALRQVPLVEPMWVSVAPVAAQAAPTLRTDGPEAHPSFLPNWIDRPTRIIAAVGERSEGGHFIKMLDGSNASAAEELGDVVDKARARTPTVGAGQAAALDRAFDGREEGDAGVGKSVETPAGNYAWTIRKIEQGAVFSGNGLPTVSVAQEKDGSIQAAIDEKHVEIEFVSAPDGLPLAMVLRGTGETLTVDLDKEPPTIVGTISGKDLSATAEGANITISYAEGRFRLILGKSAVSLASLQAGDVPEPVRRFAAYMLVVVAATVGG